MKKFLPNISEAEYTYQTPDVIKIARKNADFLRENCTPDELRTFRLNIPRRTR